MILGKRSKQEQLSGWGSHDAPFFTRQNLRKSRFKSALIFTVIKKEDHFKNSTV